MDEHDVIRFMGRFPDSITHKCETCLCTEGGHICNYSKPDYSCYIPNSDTQIVSLETQLREAQALLAAKDEMLRKVVTVLEDYGPSEELLNLCHEAPKALSLTPADALKRQAAMKRVVEWAQRHCALCNAEPPPPHCKDCGLMGLLAALEEVGK